MKLSPEYALKRPRLLLKLLFMVSVVCLAVLFYKMTNIRRQTMSLSAMKLRTKSDECDFDERVVCRVRFPFTGIAIEVFCSFLDRVHVFNAALSYVSSLAEKTIQRMEKYLNFSKYTIYRRSR